MSAQIEISQLSAVPAYMVSNMLPITFTCLVLQVQKEGNSAIIAALTEAGALLKHERYPHKYPYDWRTKQPTIFRATDQVTFCHTAQITRPALVVNKSDGA